MNKLLDTLERITLIFLNFGGKPVKIILSKWAVSCSGSAVHVIRAAIPANIGAAPSGARSSVTLLGGSHLRELGLLGGNWTVIKGGSAVNAIRAACPVIASIAAASRTAGAIAITITIAAITIVTLLGGSLLCEKDLLGTVPKGWSAVVATRAAFPATIGATTIAAHWSTITLRRVSHLCKLDLIGTVLKGWSTVQAIRTAFPASHRAAASGTLRWQITLLVFCQ